MSEQPGCSEMVELVKGAIGNAADAWAAGEGCDEVGVLDAEYCERLARAAIAAMREPTEAMLDALDDPDAAERLLQRASWREDIWRAMIDGALKC